MATGGCRSLAPPAQSRDARFQARMGHLHRTPRLRPRGRPGVRRSQRRRLRRHPPAGRTRARVPAQQRGAARTSPASSTARASGSSPSATAFRCWPPRGWPAASASPATNTCAAKRNWPAPPGSPSRPCATAASSPPRPGSRILPSIARSVARLSGRASCRSILKSPPTWSGRSSQPPRSSLDIAAHARGDAPGRRARRSAACARRASRI